MAFGVRKKKRDTLKSLTEQVESMRKANVDLAMANSNLNRDLASLRHSRDYTQKELEKQQRLNHRLQSGISSLTSNLKEAWCNQP